MSNLYEFGGAGGNNPYGGSPNSNPNTSYAYSQTPQYAAQPGTVPLSNPSASPYGFGSPNPAPSPNWGSQVVCPPNVTPFLSSDQLVVPTFQGYPPNTQYPPAPNQTPQGPPPVGFSDFNQYNQPQFNTGFQQHELTQYPPSTPPAQPANNANWNISPGLLNSASHFQVAPPSDPNKPPNPCKIHWNKVAGVATGLSEAGAVPSLKGFPTYEVQMFYVPEIFCDVWQEWNRNYESAVKIFSTAISSKVARGTIRMEHEYLYGGGLLKTETQSIGNGHVLLHIINNGQGHNGITLMYTYVVTQNSKGDFVWRFSQTGTSTLKDFASKHAVHANAARKVVYSGEFHVTKSKRTGNMKLVLDNNSGTYGPKTSELPKLITLFQRNFPGLEVEAYGYDDPILKQEIAEIKRENALRMAGQSSGSTGQLI